MTIVMTVMTNGLVQQQLHHFHFPILHYIKQHNSSILVLYVDVHLCV